jgi:hypothetical protein
MMLETSARRAATGASFENEARRRAAHGEYRSFLACAVLVNHFVQRFARRMNRTIETIPAEAMAALN